MLTYDAAHRHYDVISAPPLGWESDPFKMTARNGYLYARGVADDKGPVLATACAAADLLRARKLGVDLLFLVEGEEETGSDGFVNTVLKHKVLLVFVDFRDSRSDGFM
jgi:di- and tripeptidase